MLTPDDRATLANALRIVELRSTSIAAKLEALIARLVAEDGIGDAHCVPFDVLRRWANHRQAPIAAPERPIETPKEAEQGLDWVTLRLGA